MLILSLVMVLSCAVPGGPSGDLFNRFADSAAGPYRITGYGALTDDGHPERPFQVRTRDVKCQISVQPELGEFEITVRSEATADPDIARYYVRRGRIFQVAEDGKERDPRSLDDLRPLTVAALHPVIVAGAMRERRDMVQIAQDGALLFAWNDVLWTVQLNRTTGRIESLERRFYGDRHGDGIETVKYGYRADDLTGRDPISVQVEWRGRRIARIDFTERDSIVEMTIPRGNRRRDRARLVGLDEIRDGFKQIAEGLYSIDVKSLNTRVLVAEFSDHLVVLEGVYNARICDRIATVVRERLKKPVRFFSFSHIHAQYIGGLRSWIHGGATVLVPPATVPLVEAIATASHALRPDALAEHRRSLRVETVETYERLEDADNAIEIHNITSDHTDDFLIFYFPKQKVLLTGDLMWLRPGQVMTGRSRTLCREVQRLGLDVDQFYVTWPLDGYGIQDVVNRVEWSAGCADAP